MQKQLDKCYHYIVTKASLLSSIIQRAWTKYLGILQEVIISYKAIRGKAVWKFRKKSNH